MLNKKINMFEQMREAALETNPKEVGIKDLPEKEITVFGMVMEMGYEEGIATLVTYKTGDASMYYSGGGGFINGASHAEIKSAAENFVTFAQGFLKYAIPAKAKALPAANAVQFFFLTNKGRFLAHELNEKLGTSPWLPLYKAGNKVITEINIHSEVKIKHVYKSA